MQDRVRHVLQRMLMRDAFNKKNKVSAEAPASTSQPVAMTKMDCTHEGETDHPPSPSPQLAGYSLMIFGPRNPLRVFLAKIVWHPRFEHVIIALIICSSIVLAIDSPSVKQGSTLKTVLVRSRHMSQPSRHMCDLGVHRERT